MFGHQDDKKDDQPSEKDSVVTPDAPADTSANPETADQADQTAPPTDTGTDNTTPTADDSSAAPSDDAAWQHPGTPLDDDKEKPDEDKQDDKGPAPINDIIGGDNAGPAFKPFSQGGDSPEPAADYHNNGNDNTPHDLIDIKQKALSDLTPLVDQLDQSPEDKFRTTMMMIQASDDQTLVKSAYKAAHAIKDEKARAQALLDIVNEINYFTQHPEN